MSGRFKNYFLFNFKRYDFKLINSGLMAECVRALECLRALRTGAHVRHRADWPASLTASLIGARVPSVSGPLPYKLELTH